MNYQHKEYYRGFEIKMVYDILKEYTYAIFEDGKLFSSMRVLSVGVAKRVIDTHIRTQGELKLYPEQKTVKKQATIIKMQRPEAKYGNIQWNNL